MGGKGLAGNVPTPQQPTPVDMYNQQTASGYTPVFMKDGQLYEKTGYDVSDPAEGSPKGTPMTYTPKYKEYTGVQPKQNSPYPGTWNQNMTSGYPSSMMPSMYGQQQYGNVRHPSPQFGGPSQPQSEGRKGGRAELSNPSGTFGTLRPQGQTAQYMDLKPDNPYYKDYQNQTNEVLSAINGGVRSQPAQRFSQLGNYGANPVMSTRQRRPGGTASPYFRGF